MTGHASNPSGPAGDHASHASHGATYFAVFLALCGLTAASILADMFQLSDKNVTRAIVLAIATAKALCVMLYFMHLKFEQAWKYLLLAPTLLLAASLPFALAPDVGLHYYPQEVPQVREWQASQAAAARTHGAKPSAEQPHGTATPGH